MFNVYCLFCWVNILNSFQSKTQAPFWPENKFRIKQHRKIYQTLQKKSIATLWSQFGLNFLLSKEKDSSTYYIRKNIFRLKKIKSFDCFLLDGEEKIHGRNTCYLSNYEEDIINLRRGIKCRFSPLITA